MATSSATKSAPSVRTAATDAARKVKGGSSRSSKSDEETGGRRQVREHKKKSLMPAFIGLLGFLVLGGAAYWYFGVYMPEQNATEAKVAAERAAAKTAAAASVAPKTPEQPNEPPPVATEAPKPVDVAATTTPEKEPAKPAETEVVDDIDLMALSIQDKLAETSAEDWVTIQELAAVFTDSSAGAKGTRAGIKLKEYGKAAFPALLNRMRTLNLATDEGLRNGDLVQRLFMDICNGNNFDWRYGIEPKDVVFNKKVIRSWHTQFERARDDAAYWNKLAKITAPAGEAEAGDGKKPVLDDF